MSTRRSPRWPAERCATRANLRGDPMLGTAFPAVRLLLVEQPFPWGPEGLRTSRFDGETALAVEARGRALGVRVQAIRRPGRRPELTRRRWAFVDTRGGSPQIRWGSFVNDAELLEVPLDGSAGTPTTEPVYLVCTHGRHDPCCGQRGRPLTGALAALRPEATWQSSHLGGCRFAPTVLVLPAGVMYGRVTPSNVPELVAATDAGLLDGGLLRGRIGLPPAAQAAVGHAHARLELPRIGDVELVSTTTVDAGTVIVRVGSPKGSFDITVMRERVDATELTCGSPGPSWYVAHHPVAMRPADDA